MHNYLLYYCEHGGLDLIWVSNLILGIYLSSVLWDCWLGHFNCKNPSPMWPKIMCFCRTLNLTQTNSACWFSLRFLCCGFFSQLGSFCFGVSFRVFSRVVFFCLWVDFEFQNQCLISRFRSNAKLAHSLTERPYYQRSRVENRSYKAMPVLLWSYDTLQKFEMYHTTELWSSYSVSTVVSVFASSCANDRWERLVFKKYLLFFCRMRR